jgi:large subunit ribosomal protein L13
MKSLGVPPLPLRKGEYSSFFKGGGRRPEDLFRSIRRKIRNIRITFMNYEIDAKNKRLGRLASEIALVLQGKKSVEYAPNRVANVKVVVKNVKELDLALKKLTQKIYYRHTGYMGHLKKLTLAQMWERDPKRVVREAVRRMLPKNFLNARRLKNLIIE